ncbi:hypothetical protein V2J09_023821 [Rumex salicifolius]
MWFDIFLQAVMLLSGVFMFLWMHNIPSKALSQYRQWRDRNSFEAKRHFVNGAQLLSQAKSSKSLSLARSAESEADAAVRLDPTDAASHILKALALEYQGFKTSALDSIAVALSPLAVKSLSDEERGDALFKRAELKVDVSLLEKSGGGGLLDQAVEEDLVEAVKLRPDNARAWCLLGDCYEAKQMMEKAKEAYEAALKAQPDCKPATEALVRLGS